MLLKVRNLHKQFGGAVPVRVLHDVNFEMAEGEFVGLTGPSGAGKTTLLNIISTLDSPTSGEVLIRELNVHTLAQRELNQFRNRHLGFVFQDDLLLEHLTALENVLAPARISRRPVRQARKWAEGLLDRVGLAERLHHLPGELSGGQRQRVTIARALVNSPDLLLADEPTARLDQENGSAIVELLLELNRQMGVTILMVTHEREVAARVGRIVGFVDGRIVSDRRREPDSPIVGRLGYDVTQ